MSELSEYLPGLIDGIDAKIALKRFSKKFYEEDFLEYRRKESKVYDIIQKEVYGAEDVEQAMHQAGEIIAATAKKHIDSANFFSRSSVKADMHFIMAIYVFPGIYAMKTDSDEDLVDAVLDEWRKVFPTSELKAARFDDIYGGFKTRILGFVVDGWLEQFEKDKKDKRDRK
ncbi:MAG: hypothetical protein K5985_05600 [Lachnospiraceae bacterium]|nr:hypothetical protein [Lachnospiraceae bacterium]